MNAKKLFALFFSVLAIMLCLALAACDDKSDPTEAPTTAPTEAPTDAPTEKPADSAEHTHIFSDWKVDKAATCTSYGSTYQECECGYKQYLALLPTEHTVSEDLAVAPTCTESGKTAGSHCSVCGVVISPQMTLQPLGHTLDEGSVQTAASCEQDGIIKYTCTAEGCDYSCTEKYSLPELFAGDIYDSALSYVGEITTYDKNGEEYAIGTGSIISADGQVLTNYHVIEGAYSAIITIDEKEYELVGVLAFDKTIDLAILKIEGENLPFATLCDKPMRVGSTVYALGSSEGMTASLSHGIIAYAGREVDGVMHIQHDASISSGNSGGPLFNAYGEVIGVNTWTLIGDDSQNLNFAVSVSEIENLTYIDETPLDEFIEEYSTAFDVLYAWIESNYTSDEETYFCYDNVYDDGSWYSLGYDFDYGVLYIDVLWEYEDGSSVYISIEFDETSYEHYYYVEYTDADYNVINAIEGYIDAATFTASTALDYDYSEGDIDAETLAAYQEYVVDLLAWFEMMLEENRIGVTLNDTGFAVFESSFDGNGGNSGSGGNTGSDDNGGNSGSESSSVLDTLYAWANTNQTSAEEGYFAYDEYYDDGSWYSLGYDEEYEVMYIDVIWEFEDGYVLYSCIELTNSNNLIYYCEYADADYTTYNYIEGYINAPTYTVDTALNYDYTEGEIEIDADLLETYQLCISDLIAWFDGMLAENSVGVTLDELGFALLVE